MCFIEAFDIYFKMIHVFNKKVHPSLNLLFKFFENYAYKMHKTNKGPGPSVTNVYARLIKARDTQITGLNLTMH